jgi:tetratricopeptide (TPR) repeat protein
VEKEGSVEVSHLSVEVLARWLSGRLEHEELLQQVVPHFLARCPACRERYEELRRLQEEVGHWDEAVAAFEWREAPQLLALLRDRPYEEQLRLADEYEDLHEWGLVQLLLLKSREAVFDNPAEAVNLAQLAILISAHLGEAYDPHWVLDLRARAFAYLGNGLRVLGELRSAEDAFLEAERLLTKSMTGNTRVEAEVWDLKSSLRGNQRRLPEAIELADRALSLYKENRDQHGVARSLLAMAKALQESGELERAIDLLQHLPEELDPAREPDFFRYARYNLLGCLSLAGRHAEAEQLLPEVRRLFRDSAQPLDFVRLRWTEGSIDLGLGRTAQAEAAFREVQKEFLDRMMGYDAALAALDLAALYAQEGRTEDLRRLAGEIMPVFASREVHREAMVALILFQQACVEERLTVKLARHLADFLRRERRPRG